MPEAEFPSDPEVQLGADADANVRSYEERFEEQQSRPFPWKQVLRQAIVVVVAGVTLYLVAPSIIAVFHAWPRLRTLNLLWFIPAVVAELAHFFCTFDLQRIALRTRKWFPVVTAQLAGNAISLIVPGGAAAGAAVQFRMLSASGMDPTESAGGLTAFSFLGIGGLFALPVVVLPVVLFGSPVDPGLTDAAIIGAVGFVVLAGFSIAVMSTQPPLEVVGSLVQRVHNRLFRKRRPLRNVAERLIEQRDLIRHVLGQQWLSATLLSIGRLVFDYLCLLFCARAVGSHPNPALILLAYAVAGVIGLIPVTPGGLGVVEASLTGFLVLAGMSGADAVLTTLAYRMASYWVPMMTGPIAYAAFRHRYRPPAATQPPELAA